MTGDDLAVIDDHDLNQKRLHLDSIDEAALRHREPVVGVDLTTTGLCWPRGD